MEKKTPNLAIELVEKRRKNIERLALEMINLRTKEKIMLALRMFGILSYELTPNTLQKFKERNRNEKN